MKKHFEALQTVAGITLILIAAALMLGFFDGSFLGPEAVERAQLAILATGGTGALLLLPLLKDRD